MIAGHMLRHGVTCYFVVATPFELRTCCRRQLPQSAVRQIAWPRRVPGRDASTIASVLLWRRPHLSNRRRGAALLVIGGNRRDLLVVELLGEESHRFGAVIAESALPHFQLERDVVRVLPAEIRHRRQLASAARAVAGATAGKPLRCIPGLGELLAFRDEVLISCRERRERSFRDSVIRGNI